MYNDYYLQQIDSKLSITNSKLDDVIYNQNVILQKCDTLISGDKNIVDSVNNNSNVLNIGLLWIAVIGFAILFYNFFHVIFNHRGEV